MESMLEYLKANPTVAGGLILLICVTVFVWYKAIQSSKKRAAERDKIIAGLEKEKALRNDYRNITPNKIENEKDDYRLIQGVCANIQMKLEKLDDINNEFNQMSEYKKNVYCLGYIFEDSKNKLSDFFRSNGEPLLSASVNAVSTVISGEFAEIFEAEFNMLDDSNENISLDNAQLEAYDDKFRKIMDNNSENIYSVCAEYIKNGIQELM